MQSGLFFSTFADYQKTSRYIVNEKLLLIFMQASSELVCGFNVYCSDEQEKQLSNQDSFLQQLS